MSARVWLTGAAVGGAIVAVFLIVQSRRDVVLPLPVERDLAETPDPTVFVGADRCANCHRAEHAAWSTSTHGRAGGPPSARTVLAPFSGATLRLADARVTPRVRTGAWEFVVEQTGEPARVLRVDGVVGGGHIYGGGTQAFVTRAGDGTWRILPFEWSRQDRTWFCNTSSRSGRGWAPITGTTRLTDCGDWPPVRAIGEVLRYANCQSCHASQATVVLDTARQAYATHFTSLAINCESCHGPGRAHVDAAERGNASTTSTAGLEALATLNKDAAMSVCLQCHAIKDRLRDGFISGRPLLDFYSVKFPHLGDRPLHPDGRVRTFAYQEGHLFSACYYGGGMTCTSCHDPHAQRYRTVTGAPLRGRFDDGQCLGCHVSKADRVAEHTRHATGSPGSACTACHMPLRQAPETRPVAGSGPARVVAYARSDHTISIPRPRVDSTLGMGSPCAGCHANLSVDDQERLVRAMWGELKPLPPAVAAQVSDATRDSGDARLLLPDTGLGQPHTMATFAGLARYLEMHVAPGVPIARDLERRLRRLASAPDVDVRALALAALHLSGGDDRRARRALAAALRSEGARDLALRSRWALALAFKADRYLDEGALDGAITVYRFALEVRPDDARILSRLAQALHRGGDRGGAVAMYRRSVESDPSVPLTWVNLGIALAGAGDTTAAVGALLRATGLDRSEPLAWYNLANLSYVRGDVAQARSLYARAATLDPGLALAHFQLARLSLLARDEASALTHLRRGLRFDSSDASARAMAAELAARVQR